MRKLLVTLISIITYTITYAQTGIPDASEQNILKKNSPLDGRELSYIYSTNKKANDAPQVVVDSEVVPFSNFSWIDVNAIENIAVLKDSTSIVVPRNSNGILLIKLKDRAALTDIQHLQFCSLPVILKKHLTPQQLRKKALYFVDGELLKDTTGIAIPASRITNVNTTTSAELPYLKTAFPDVLIVKIFTTRFRPETFIRGATPAK